MARCPLCCGKVIPDARWCRICDANLLNPTIGRLASPARRLAAFLLDVAIARLVYLATDTIATVWLEFYPESSAGAMAAVVLMGAYVAWAFKLFTEGTTPGKLRLRMKVVRESGRRAGFGVMLLREWFGKALSAIGLGIGFLGIVFDRNRQGWHNKLGSTYVVVT